MLCSFPGGSVEYADCNNHHLLAALYGHYGFESVQYSVAGDHNKARTPIGLLTFLSWGGLATSPR